MTIEVRQILIKASVTKSYGEEAGRIDADQAYEAIKADILEQCRRLIVEILQEERER